MVQINSTINIKVYNNFKTSTKDYPNAKGYVKGQCDNTLGEGLFLKKGTFSYPDEIENWGSVQDLATKGLISFQYPQISTLTITPVTGLKAEVAIDTKVADLSATGGTSPYTYSLASDGTDNASFKIAGTQVQAKVALAQKEYQIKVKVTDAKGQTKEQTATISVGASA